MEGVSAIGGPRVAGRHEGVSGSLVTVCVNQRTSARKHSAGKEESRGRQRSRTPKRSGRPAGKERPIQQEIPKQFFLGVPCDDCCGDTAKRSLVLDLVHVKSRQREISKRMLEEP